MLKKSAQNLTHKHQLLPLLHTVQQQQQQQHAHRRERKRWLRMFGCGGSSAASATSAASSSAPSTASSSADANNARAQHQARHHRHHHHHHSNSHAHGHSRARAQSGSHPSLVLGARSGGGKRSARRQLAQTLLVIVLGALVCLALILYFKLFGFSISCKYQMLIFTNVIILMTCCVCVRVKVCVVVVASNGCNGTHTQWIMEKQWPHKFRFLHARKRARARTHKGQ